MKKTKFFKWSRLLVSAVMAVTLALMLAPAAVLAQDCDVCEPDPVCAECQDNCKLQVNIIMPDDGTEVYVGDYFWVNATVAKPKNVDGTIEGVMVEVCYDENVCLVDCCAQQGPFDLSNCWSVRDFWWKFKCKDDDPADIKVRAWVGEDGCAGDCDTVTVKQLPEPCDKLEVCIIECPTEPIMPSTTFAVKALVKNMTEEEICDVEGEIEIHGPASLVDCDDEWNLGGIRPGDSEEVGWTLHCDGGGQVDINIEAEADFGRCGKWECEVQDTCTVYQICEAALSCGLTAPDKVCTDCDNCFDVTVDYRNLCGIYTWIEDICATIHVEGGAVIVGAPTVGMPNLPAGGEDSYTWTVCCTEEGNAEVWVELNGWDPVFHKSVNCQTSVHVVDQNYPLMVEIMEPNYGEKISVGQQFQLKYRLTNCRDLGGELENIMTGLAMDWAINPCVKLADTTVQAIPDPQSGVQPFTLQAEPGPQGCWKEVEIECLLDCCYVDLVWTLECCCSGLCDVDIDEGNCGGDCTWMCKDKIEAYARMDGWEDWDSVEVQQMDPPCLEASVEAYKGLISDGTFDCEETIKRSDCMAIAYCDYFTVVVPVANLGDATAQNVCVTIDVAGPAELVDTEQSMTQCLGNIGCHESAKAVWEFHCDGAGEVRIVVTSLTGTDQNNGADITCFTHPFCPIFIDQIPLDIDIIQPLTCTSFIEGDSFTVKAKICNNDDAITLGNVKAELCWTGVSEGWWGWWKDGGGDMCLAEGQGNPISIEEMLPGECAEVTWQVKCCDDGDVKFWVNVWNEGCCNEEHSPSIKVSSDSETIHQYEAGHICCYIVSPKFSDYDDCCEYGEPAAFIGTGQEYTVTAKMFNSGDRPFTVDSVELMDDWCWGDDGNIEIVGGPYFVWPDAGNPGVLCKKETAMVSWDVVCTDPGKTDLKVKVSGEDDMNTKDSCCSWVTVEQYSAAHLVAQITACPVSVSPGDEFALTAMVCNYGDADAWEAGVRLIVNPEGGVVISENDPDGGYVKGLGNLTGHGFDECQTVTWLLRKVTDTNTTLVVHPFGKDEYGYEVKQICESEIVGTVNPGTGQITCCELVLHGTPGAPIQEGFIRADACTVDPNGDGGDGGCTECNFDIQLDAGWNLVSMPYYVMPDDRDPQVLLAGILDTMEAAFVYDACTMDYDGFSAEFPTNPPSELQSMRDGPGYWILMNEPDVLSILNPFSEPGDMPVNPTYTVDCTGYNLIGPRIGEQTDTLTVDDWLGSKPVSAVVGWDNGSNSFFILTGSSYIQPGEGYFVFFDGTAVRAY